MKKQSKISLFQSFIFDFPSFMCHLPNILPKNNSRGVNKIFKNLNKKQIKYKKLIEKYTQEVELLNFSFSWLLILTSFFKGESLW
jgi:hypothetical protein